MYSAIRKNKINTVLIMLLFVVIIGALGMLAGAIYGDPKIVGVTVVGALGYAVLQYFIASRMALSMAGAREITEQEHPRLYRIVENLAITTGMPMPRVYIIEDSAPNAFATGRNPQNAVVAATTGLLELMTDRELEGVMAHELGHVKNYDIRVNMIVYGLVVAIGMLADLIMRLAFYGGQRGRSNGGGHPAILLLGLLAMLVAPLLATVVQLAISRQREYLADASGALVTRDAPGLASALHKLQEYGRPLQKQNTAMAHMWLADPLEPSALQKLFATHPPLPDRIRRLLEIQDKF